MSFLKLFDVYYLNYSGNDSLLRRPSFKFDGLSLEERGKTLNIQNLYTLQRCAETGRELLIPQLPYAFLSKRGMFYARFGSSKSAFFSLPAVAARCVIIQ